MSVSFTNHQRKINLYLSRYLSVRPERIRMRASERVMRSELDDTSIHAHDNIVEHVRDVQNLEIFVGTQGGIGKSRLVNTVLTTLEDAGDTSLLEIPAQKTFQWVFWWRTATKQKLLLSARNILPTLAPLLVNTNTSTTNSYSFPFSGFRNQHTDDEDDEDDDDLSELVWNCVHFSGHQSCSWFYEHEKTTVL